MFYCTPPEFMNCMGFISEGLVSACQMHVVACQEFRPVVGSDANDENLPEPLERDLSDTPSVVPVGDAYTEEKIPEPLVGDLGDTPQIVPPKPLQSTDSEATFGIDQVLRPRVHRPEWFDHAFFSKRPRGKGLYYKGPTSEKDGLAGTPNVFSKERTSSDVYERPPFEIRTLADTPSVFPPAESSEPDACERAFRKFKKKSGSKKIPVRKK